MRTNPFESQLERLARTLTEQFGVNVICQGDNAWTDGKQIVLPSIPEPLAGDLERMMLGYLDHEMAHVAFSDFGVAGEFERKHPGSRLFLALRWLGTVVGIPEARRLAGGAAKIVEDSA